MGGCYVTGKFPTLEQLLNSLKATTLRYWKDYKILLRDCEVSWEEATKQFICQAYYE